MNNILKIQKIFLKKTITFLDYFLNLAEDENRKRIYSLLDVRVMVKINKKAQIYLCLFVFKIYLSNTKYIL